MADYLIAKTDDEYSSTELLFKEYATWLNIDLSFQHFEKELFELKTMYAAPQGGIILCKAAHEFIASIIQSRSSRFAETADLEHCGYRLMMSTNR